MAFLEAITAKDLGVFMNNQDFIGVQTMREGFRQEISRRGAFGSDGAVIQMVRASDETTVSFSFILLVAGVQRGLNEYETFKLLRDFEISSKKGNIIETYRGCNWTSVDIDSGLDQVMVNIDISAPGLLHN